MLKTSELRVIEGQELQLVCAGDVMGWLGGLPLSLMEDVRMGRPAAGAKTAHGSGAVGRGGLCWRYGSVRRGRGLRWRLGMLRCGRGLRGELGRALGDELGCA